MHDIEPYHKWRAFYIASEDDKSPFYGRIYDEFKYTKKIYNYFIHPQWDEFGSQTLYSKILFVDYSSSIACIELIGEWNDCLSNDIMFLKRELIDSLRCHGIIKFAIFCDNVLTYHCSDDSYYEEWYDDIKEEGGWIAFLNTSIHVRQEMESIRLQNYVNLGLNLNDVNWRNYKPTQIMNHIEQLLSNQAKSLNY